MLLFAKFEWFKDLLNVCSLYAIERVMVVNYDKFVGILDHSKQFDLSSMPNCQIDDKVIKFTCSVKYLGVWIDGTITENEDTM